MSCLYSTQSVYTNYEQPRQRSNSIISSSCSTEHVLVADSFSQQTKSVAQQKFSKLIQNIIVANPQSSKSPSPVSGQLSTKSTSDEQMDNLNIFFNILSQIHQQQSSDQLKKEESALIERKRELRKLKIQRYREKKQARKWDVLRYEVRKNIAKSRLRIKGRFVRE